MCCREDGHGAADGEVGDLNLWNAHNTRERFWASRTKQLYAAHVSAYDRLWSTLPNLRPMATIIYDSLAWYGADEHGVWPLSFLSWRELS
jgi:uncharacterized protein YcgI (DUF1989 family)